MHSNKSLQQMYVEDELVEMCKEDTRSLHSVTVIFSRNSMRSVNMRKLRMSSKDTQCKITYKLDLVSDFNLLSEDLFQKLFSTLPENK